MTLTIAPDKISTRMGEAAQAPLQVFILGPARSGTSIMWLAMRRVFNLAGKGESHVLPVILRMTNTFEAYKKKLPANVIVNSLQSDELQTSLGGMLRQFYAREFPTGRWVDKTPGVEALHAAWLTEQMFPEARLIVTKRNGIEVVHSFRHKFSAGFAHACRTWTKAMAAVESSLPICRSALVLDQFDLVNDTTAAAERICDHLSEPHKAKDLARFLTTERRDQKSTHDWSRRLTLAEVDWSPEEKETFRSICGPYMEKMGYPM